MKSFLTNFIRFSRLHTIIGTTLSITSLFLIARGQGSAPFESTSVLGWTLLSCLAANLYIVGLNQLSDVEIDKINKPYLPLASGAFSKNTAVVIVSTSLVISLLISVILGHFLLLTVFLSIVLGTAYSQPPIRLKRFPFWASFCIIAVRGLIVNLLLFLFFNSYINDRINIPPIIYLLTGLIFIYSVIIAWFKDIPDMVGDKKHAIETFSIRLGAQRIFMWGNIILLTAYALLVLYASFYFAGTLRSGLVVSHLIMSALLGKMLVKTNPVNSTSMARYYQFIWILFFCEYLQFGLFSL